MTKGVALHSIIISSSQIVQSSLQIISISSRCHRLFLIEAPKVITSEQTTSTSNRSSLAPILLPNFLVTKSWGGAWK